MSEGRRSPSLPMVAQTVLPTEETARLTERVLERFDTLVARIRQKGSMLVAYSGGVDSALIAAAGIRAIGAYDASKGRGTLAVLADSSTLARRELQLARTTADAIGVPLEEVRYSELDNASWSANAGDRCYHCKKDLAGVLNRLAPTLGFPADHIAYGVTTSDLGDHRPGIEATKEASGWHPLVEAGIAKPEVRALAKHLGLPVWDKPATPCLASRVQYGEHITAETLHRVEAAEDAVRALGFRVFRVRNHDRLARIEVPASEIDRAVALREALVSAVRGVGYTYVTLDLLGFRSGAMNEALDDAPGDPGPGPSAQG